MTHHTPRIVRAAEPGPTLRPVIRLLGPEETAHHDPEEVARPKEQGRALGGFVDPTQGMDERHLDGLPIFASIALALRAFPGAALAYDDAILAPAEDRP